MTKQVKMVVLGKNEETEKAVNLDTLVVTKAGQKMVSVWVPKSLLVWDGGMTAELPAWKAKQLGAEAGQGDVALLVTEPA